MKSQCEKMIQIAQELDFYTAAPLDVSTLKPNPEVRKMCESNKCHQYDKNWACPPGCGTLEECQNKIAQYECGILLQTVGDIEDSFDFEAMTELEQQHTERFLKLVKALREMNLEIFPLNVGCCTNCEQCTYPDAPCRAPEQAYSSVEAYGLIVSELCKDNKVNYYYGSDKMAYTACILY